MTERPRGQTVSVIGLGYIGLPTAAALASRGVRVLGVDTNPRVIDAINRGEVLIAEPELHLAVRSAVESGYLRAVGVPEPASAFLLAVPTPVREDGTADLSYVEAATAAVAPVLERGNLVVLESTSPVGTTERIAEWLAAARPDLSLPSEPGAPSDVRVAYCPERVLPGRTMQELVENERVIGGLTPRCSAAATALYRQFVRGQLHVTDSRTAELCKLAENSFRDVNIAFANELSMLCARLEVDVWELIALANRHPRVEILRPGAGVGGHCVAVDPWFLIQSAPDLAKLVRTARNVNDSKPEWLLRRIDAAISRIGRRDSRDRSARVRVALLGLTFKPNIEDLRESPALHIAEQLTRREDILLTLVEPNITLVPPALGDHQLMDLESAMATAELVVVLVAHREFAGLGPSPDQIVIDAVGVVDTKPSAVERRGVA